MRLNGLQYGMTAIHVQLPTEICWASFDVATLLVAIENWPNIGRAAAELVSSWKRLQKHKSNQRDVSFICNGRNAVELTVSFNVTLG
jgi:hypothetical protein